MAALGNVVYEFGHFFLTTDKLREIVKMFMRLFLVATLAFFICGCSPAKKENVVIPKKNPDAEKVEDNKGDGREPPQGRGGQPKGPRRQ